MELSGPDKQEQLRWRQSSVEGSIVNGEQLWSQYGGIFALLSMFVRSVQVVSLSIFAGRRTPPGGG